MSGQRLSSFVTICGLILATQMPAQTAVNVAPQASNGTQPANLLFGNPKNNQDFTVWVVSSRPGLTFTDSETVDVRVRVGAALDETTIDYTIQETEGPWQTDG